MDFWATDRRGAVEIAAFSNPPHNYLSKPVIDELGQLVAGWQDPSVRAVVIQSRAEDSLGFSQYSVEELHGLASDPTTSRYSGSIENMNWTEVMQSDDAQVALSTFLAVDPDSRRDWFESESTKTYPAYSGH